MAARGSRLLLAGVAMMALPGCMLGSDADPDSPDAKPATSAEPEGDEATRSATNTGSPAPGRADSAGRELERCFGRRPTILGGPGDDVIRGTNLDDVIVTFDGDDTIRELRKADRVCTGAGEDVVTDVEGGQVQIGLGDGNDRVATLDASVVLAGDGADRVVVTTAAMQLAGGPDDDLMRVVDPRPRTWAVNTPCVDYRAVPGPMRINLTRGWARGQGHDRLIGFRCVFGGRFGNHVIGSPDDDDLDVSGAANVVWSRAGNDAVYNNLGEGEDVYHLGPGNDAAMPGEGADRVYGGPGRDFVEAAGGPDYVGGGRGNDVLHASYRCDFGNSGGAGTVDEHGNELFGGRGADYLAGDLGNDRLDGGPGSDRGQGGYMDGRVDWIESLERIVRC